MEVKMAHQGYTHPRGGEGGREIREGEGKEEEERERKGRERGRGKMERD